MSQGPVILGIDEDREAQAALAQHFNEQGIFYRFITDRRKVRGGIAQLKPELLLLFGELSSNFVIQVLDTLASDVDIARFPVVVVANDTSDAEFVQGFRTGVTAIIPAPLDASHSQRLRALLTELQARSGVSAGATDAAGLARLNDHLRRTRRSGELLTEPRTPQEGSARYVYGRLDTATFQGAHGPDALTAMLQQPQARWSFQEMAGAHSEGAGVVIEVGEIVTGELPVGQIIEIDEPMAPAAPPPPPSPAGAHILLVDDDAALLTLFSRLFERHGFTVTTALDGAQGLQLAASQPFDVVLADLNMPHLDGWGMLRALRDDFRTRELPIAFLSAHDDYRESLRALDAGAQAYLKKGTKLDVIVSQVNKLLEPRRAALAMLEINGATGEEVPLAIHALGPRWLLQQLAWRRATGALIAKDSWATWTFGFVDGACVHASGVAGKYTAVGERAFNAFVASRAAEGTFAPGVPSPAANLHGDTAALLEHATQTLNDNEQRARDTLLLAATDIEVHAELYQVYRAVGPKESLEVARLICEEKATPRDIIARVELSPVEIEETMKDLLRRGVVTLKKRA